MAAATMNIDNDVIVTQSILIPVPSDLKAVKIDRKILEL